MLFPEFMIFIRQHIGYKGDLVFWLRIYRSLKDISKEFLIKELPFLAVHATARDWEDRGLHEKTRNRRKI